MDAEKTAEAVFLYVFTMPFPASLLYQRPKGGQMLPLADKEGRMEVRQMLALADDGGRGGLANADITDKRSLEWP